MRAIPRPCGRAAIALACISQGCFLLPVDPAPTMDVPESPELAARLHGSIVVADQAPRLFVVSLPDGCMHEFPTKGDAMVASGIDPSGRIAYVREEEWMWPFGRSRYKLVVKSLVTGEERKLCEVDRGDADRPDYLVVDLAAGRAMAQFKSRRPVVFDVDTGCQLDLSWWPKGLAVQRLSGDGRSLICQSAGLTWDRPRWLAIDLQTGSQTPIWIGMVDAFDLDGRIVRLYPNRRPESTDYDEHIAEAREAWPPGCTRWPITMVGDTVVLYEGLASPASHPDSRGGLMFPTFDRSIRIADSRTRETATLVPRYDWGSFAYSRHGVPAQTKSGGSEPGK